MILMGTITKILTQKDDDWGRYVVNNPNGDLIAVGIIPAATLRMKVTLVGEETDNKYGHSFQISGVLNTEIDKNNGILAFLASGLLPGVGESTAKQIVDKYGDKALDIFEAPDVDKKLLAVNKIGPKKLDKIKAGYKKGKKYKDIYLLLNGAVTANQARKIYQKYGKGSAKVLKENPYRLIDDIVGYGFQTVDALARSMGIKADSEYRLTAAMQYAIEIDTFNSGNCYCSPDELKTAVLNFLCPLPSLPDLSERAAEKAVQNWNSDTEETLLNEGTSYETIDILKTNVETRTLLTDGLGNAIVKAIEQGTIVNDDGRIYSKKMYRIETDAAKRLSEMAKSRPVRFIRKEVIENTIQQIEQEKDREHPEKAPFKITSEQKHAIYTGLMNRVCVISGGPGRGKTTITEAIARAFAEARGGDRSDVIMLAPTGRAAQRMKEATGFEAITAHRAILRALKKSVPKEAALNLGDLDIPADCGNRPQDKLIICDETSMVDIYLFQKILWYAKNCNLIFVGDADQLPSVGPGSVLRDMIASEEIPCVLLKEGHRNSGAIAQNAAMINRGLPMSQYVYDEHFRYFPVTRENVLERVVNDYVLMCNQYGQENVMLCTAMRQRGPSCVNALNTRLQEIYTKGHPEVQSGGRVFRVGDRVMNIKNNYQFDVKRPIPDLTQIVGGEPKYTREDEPGIFNGEKGTVYRIAEHVREEKIMSHGKLITIQKPPVKAVCVRFDDGSLAAYDPEDLPMLTLSYATTVHKCQGSEAKCVMLVFTYADYILLNRALFYTGETRAQQEFRFYGETKNGYSVFDMAASRTEEKKRKTWLAERIQVGME